MKTTSSGTWHKTAASPRSFPMYSAEVILLFLRGQPGLLCTILIPCLLLFFPLFWLRVLVFCLPNEGCFLKAQSLTHSIYVLIGLRMYVVRLLLSSSTYKETGSWKLCLHESKKWDRKTNSVSIIHKRGGHWANWGPQDGRDRKANPGRYIL